MVFKKEEGFSLLELSVAVGVAAIVAVAAIGATTSFIGSAQKKSNDYTSNAASSINDASAQSSALGVPGASEESEPGTWTSGAPVYSVVWNAGTSSFIFTVGTCDSSIRLEGEYYNGSNWATHVNQVSGLTSEGGTNMCATGVDRYSWDNLGGTATWNLSDQSLSTPFDARYRLVNAAGEYTQWYSLQAN